MHVEVFFGVKCFNHIGNLNHITDVVIHCKADIVKYVLFANYESMETKSFI